MATATEVKAGAKTIHGTLEELIRAVDSRDWFKALVRVEDLEDQIEFILLTRWCEPNYIHDDFRKLKLWLSKPLSDSLKVKLVRECIANILDKISTYGLSVGRLNPDSAKLATTLESLCQQIDYLFPSVFSRLEKDRLSAITEIRSYLNTIERYLISFRSDRSSLVELSELALSDLRNFKSVLSRFVYSDANKKSDDISQAFLEFIDSIGKLSRALQQPEISEHIIRVFEVERGVSLSREVIGITGEEGAGGGAETKPKKSVVSGKAEGEPTFDWIDDEWDQVLTHPKVYLIVGQRGMGKSSLGHSIAEYLVKKYNIKAYLLNTGGKPVPSKKLKLLPKWMTVIDRVDDAPNNCVLLIDEAYLKFHARTAARSGESVTMDKLLELSRQKSQSLIYITQRSDKIDKNVVSAINVLLIKKPSKFQLPSEREGLKEYMVKAYKAFSRVKNPKEHVYIVSDDPEYIGLKKCGLASYWCEELSTFYEAF